LTKNRFRACSAIVFFVSATVLFTSPFLAVEGWRRWLLMAIFGLPGAFAFWLGMETLRCTPNAIAEDSEMDGMS
jgi:hypothetical protein